MLSISLRYGMKLKTLFALFALGVAVLVVLTMAIFDRAIQSIEQDSLKVREIANRVYLAEKLENLLRRHNREAFWHVVTGSDTSREQKIEAREEMALVLNEIRNSIVRPHDQELMKRIEDDINGYFSVRRRLEKNSPPLEAYRKVTREIDRIGDSTHELAMSSARQVQNLEFEITRKSQFATMLGLSLGGVIALTLLFSFLAAFWFIYRPLIRISDGLSKYSRGDLKQRLRVSGPRELQDLSQTFNEMADRIDRQKAEQIGFLASVAHDLRNPLNSVLMSSELLISRFGKPGQEEDRKFLEIIRRQMTNLDRLVGDLLDTTRIESGHFDLKTSFCEIGRMLRDAIDLNRTSTHIHQFELDLPDRPIYAQIDAARISQVLNNLVSNAIKYSPKGGLIRVTAEPNRDHLRIMVSDEGMGIETSEQHSIFEPFRRGNASRNTTLGIGLGLSTSRKIIEAHNGTLNVESRPGEGSTFIIRLPQADHQIQRSSDAMTPT